MAFQFRRPLAQIFLILFVLANCDLTHATDDGWVNRIGFLIHSQHYGEAADMIASSENQNSVATQLNRAILLLYCNKPEQAETRFRQVKEMLPANDPLPDYGLGLCALISHDFSTAQLDLDRAEENCTDTDQKENVTDAIALLRLANNDPDGAARQALVSGSLMARELVVLQKLRSASTPSERAIAVTSAEQFETETRLPGSIPRVLEDNGLHAVGLRTEQRGTLIDSPITTSDFADSILRRISRSNTSDISAATGVISGIYTITAKDQSQIRAGSFVSFLVDDRLAAESNSGSYTFRWDSRTVANGTHQVKIEISDSTGRLLDTQSISLNIYNANSLPQATTTHHGALSPEDIAAVNDSWELLRLNPSYKILQLALAQAYFRLGQRTKAEEHLTIASALDFSYAGGAHSLAGIYTGRIPTFYPLPAGERVIDASANSAISTTMGLWRGNPNIKEVALTFDDGPSPTETPHLLQALDDSHATATFFVVGTRAQAAPDLIHRMHDSGYEVEDHTYTHPNLDEALEVHVYEEILRNAVVVRSLTGIWPHFLRPPGGQTNHFVLDAAQNCGMAGAFWTIDALPAEDIGSPAGVVDYVMKRIKPGAVILMHNGTVATTKAVPELVARLKASGYRLVTMLQLAQDATSLAKPYLSTGTKVAQALLHR